MVFFELLMRFPEVSQNLKNPLLAYSQGLLVMLCCEAKEFEHKFVQMSRFIRLLKLLVNLLFVIVLSPCHLTFKDCRN